MSRIHHLQESRR